MGSFVWKAYPSGTRVEFMQAAIPPSLLDPITQQPLLIGVLDVALPRWSLSYFAGYWFAVCLYNMRFLKVMS